MFIVTLAPTFSLQWLAAAMLKYENVVTVVLKSSLSLSAAVISPAIDCVEAGIVASFPVSELTIPVVAEDV